MSERERERERRERENSEDERTWRPLSLSLSLSRGYVPRQETVLKKSKVAIAIKLVLPLTETKHAF